MISDLSTMVTAIGALAAVLALVLALARLARRGGFASRPATGRALSVEEVLPLDTRRRLHLLRCGEHRVLLLTGGADDLVVGWLPDGEQQAGREREA
ncbi:MAG: flagellar biosynthetic protein FliO [Acetobacteraceae bacterium]